MNKFRFSAPIGGGYFNEAANYLDDSVERVIEIKVIATELEQVATFRIWTDKSKKLHLERM